MIDCASPELETFLDDFLRVAGFKILVCDTSATSLTNADIVASLQRRGANAIGLNGADGDALRGISHDGEVDIKASSVNTRFIEWILNGSLVPVFSTLVHDCNGSLLDCNANHLTAAIATALAFDYDTEVYFCGNSKGVLRDTTNPSTIISAITQSEFNSLKEDGSLSEGTIETLEQAFALIRQRVRAVIIKHPAQILSPSGTTIY